MMELDSEERNTPASYRFPRGLQLCGRPGARSGRGGRPARGARGGRPGLAGRVSGALGAGARVSGSRTSYRLAGDSAVGQYSESDPSTLGPAPRSPAEKPGDGAAARWPAAAATTLSPGPAPSTTLSPSAPLPADPRRRARARLRQRGGPSAGPWAPRVRRPKRRERQPEARDARATAPRSLTASRSRRGGGGAGRLGLNRGARHLESDRGARTWAMGEDWAR